MRRIILLPGYILITLSFCSGSVCFAQEAAVLPHFNFPDPDGVTISHETFRNGRPLIVFYYEPTCSHCQQQAAWVGAQLEDFDEVDLLWVAWEPSDDVGKYYDQYFVGFPSVYFAVDQEGVFDSLFGFSQIPTIYVYDELNALVRKFKKETRPEKLLKALGRKPN